jgi:hypothetical protein
MSESRVSGRAVQQCGIPTSGSAASPQCAGSLLDRGVGRGETPWPQNLDEVLARIGAPDVGQPVPGR